MNNLHISSPSDALSATSSSLPPKELRFGVGLRRNHFDTIHENHEGIDFLEILPENYMDFGGRPRHVLRRAREQFPIVTHGVSLSIGGLDPLDMDYLRGVRELVKELDAPWFSDHLCYASAFGVQYHDLLPLPFTAEAIDHVVARVRTAQEFVGRPLLLENPSYYVEMPGKEMSEAEFLVAVATRADCGILLDVNNVYVNATNHGYDARAFIDAMPAERVLQLHIAGHDDTGPFLIDTHGSHIIDEVFDLYAYTLKRIGPAWTLLEWDNEIPDLPVLLAENANVRRVAASALGRPDLLVRGDTTDIDSAHLANDRDDRTPSISNAPPNDPPSRSATQTSPARSQQARISLKETIETMHALLRGKLPLERAAALLGMKEERLAVYPSFVKGHMRNILDKNYATLAALLVGDVWEGLASDFYDGYPSPYYELNANAAVFVDFLRGELDAGRPGLTPAHVEIAELEWQEFATYADPREIPPPEDLEELTLNPTLAVLQFTHPVAAFVAAFREAEQGADNEKAAAMTPPSLPETPESEIVLIFRHPETDLVETMPTTEALLFAFKMTHDALSPAQAAKESGLDETKVIAILDEAVEVGLVLLPGS